MRRDELETSASTRGVAMITEKCKCRDLQHTKPSLPERNCENKGTSCGRRFSLFFGLSMRARNNWEKQSWNSWATLPSSHIPFGIQVSWLTQKEERQPASVSFFNLGSISYSNSKHRFADLPHSYGLFCLQKSRHGQKTFPISPQQLQKNLLIAHFQNELPSIILVFWCCYSFSLLRVLFEDAALAGPCSSSLPPHPWSTFPGCCWPLALCCSSSWAAQGHCWNGPESPSSISSAWQHRQTIVPAQLNRQNTTEQEWAASTSWQGTTTPQLGELKPAPHGALPSLANGLNHFLGYENR